MIILRKHLKSTFNLEKLNLAKKIKKLKQSKKQNNAVARRESELECFKRVKVSDIPLATGIHPEILKKHLTNPSSAEIDRVFARVLLNRQVQETIIGLKENYGLEFVETFLKSNGKNIQNNKTQQLSKGSAKKSKKVRKESLSSNEESEDPEDENQTSSDEDDNQDEAIDEVPDEPKPKIQKNSSTEKKSKPPATPAPKEKVSSKVPTKKDKKSVDSFFVNPSGENYYASVRAADSSGSESESETVKKPARKPTANPAAKKFKNPKSSNQTLKKSSSVKQKYEKYEKPEKLEPVKVEPSADSIHPSWKAKAEMRKSQIQAFAGTKIKFDD